MANAIIDGKGTGRRAEVTSENRLKVEAVVEDSFIHAAEEGMAFNINTKAIVVSGTPPFTQDVLYVKNNESESMEIVGWFIGEGDKTVGGGSDEPMLFEMYGQPTGTASGTAVGVVNRRIGSPREFQIEALSKPTGLTVTGEPLLYQYHYGGRAFGTVYFTIPSGASILIRVNSNYDSVTFYTGFTGYIGD